MLKQLMLKLVRSNKGGEGRGSKAPALLLLARQPGRFVRRVRQASRGDMLAGGGVIAAAVVFVSLLSWLAPDSDRPIGTSSPLEVIERVAGGVLKQVDEQAAALLGTDAESMMRSLREGVAAASSRTPWPGGGPREVAAERSSGADSAAPTSAASTASGEASSTPGGEFSPDSTSQPSSSQAPSGTSETPPAADTPSSPTTSEPVPPPASDQPPPATEEPSPPAAEEPPPATEQPAPPAEEPPPAAEEPPPVAEEPPPAVEEPTPAPVDPPLL